MSRLSAASAALVLTFALGATGAGAQDAPPSDTTAAVAAVDAPVPTLPIFDGVTYDSVVGLRATVLHAPDERAVAERVSALLDGQAPLPGLAADAPSGVRAILAHTPAAFDEAVGSAVPEWRAGVAIPTRNTLVMPTGEGIRVVDGEGLRTLRHEWAHLGLGQYLGTDLRIPRWFNEGYAQWASGGFETDGAWRLRVLLATDQAPAMDSLALRWPAGREEARTAYLLAASAVTYLLQSGGEAGLRVFLDRWRAQRSFEGAFRETFGLTVGQFEEDWRRHVKDRYGWLFVLSHSAVFWLVLALVLLFMVRGRRAYNRQKLARLRAGEIPDAPAFWDEPDPPDGSVPHPPGVGDEP